MTTLSVNTLESKVVAKQIATGVLVSGTAVGFINYNQYKKEQMSKEEALKNGLKVVVQGGIATGTAIAISRYVERKSFIGALSALSLGVAGIYGVEKFYRKTIKTIEETNQTEAM